MARRSLKSRPTLWWDPSLKSYILKTAPNGKFDTDLRMILDVAPTWNGNGWLIDEDDVDNAKVAIDAHFPESDYGKLDFIAKPKPQQQRAHTNGGSEAGNAALAMFEVGGYDDARQVYSFLIKKYHPDKTSNPDDHAKAAMITTSWRKVKEHFGWG